MSSNDLQMYMGGGNPLLARRRMMAGKKKGGGGLPSEYQEVEWINNGAVTSGGRHNGFINTHYIIRSEKIEGEVYVGPYEGYPSLLYMGAVADDVVNGMLLYGGAGDGAIRLFAGGTISSRSYNKNQKFSFRAEYGNGCFNSSDFKYTGSLISGLPIYLFPERTSVQSYSEKTYMGRVWLKDNGRLAFDYIPCYRIADNIVGMYNLVSKSFHTSDNEYAFIAGPDVI